MQSTHREAALKRLIPLIPFIAGFQVAVLFFPGCALNELPATGPSGEAVLQAAREVIAERYPMSAATATAEDGFVLAVTPSAMEGGAKTRRQISVLVSRNYTGTYEPVVRVRQYLDMGSADFDGDPEEEYARLAAPLDRPRWRPMGYLEYEEQDLTDAILRKLGFKGL